MWNKLSNFLTNYPRLALILIVSISVLALMVFITLLKGVALMLLTFIIVGLVYLIRKPFKKNT